MVAGGPPGPDGEGRGHRAGPYAGPVTRTFDLHEANRLLPRIRGLVAQVVELNGQLPELQDQLRIAEYRMRRTGALPSDGDRFEELASAARAAEDDLRAALSSLEELGVRLKDAREGLVDFPTIREGEPAELCWRLGEDGIGWWHPLGAGFAGRRRL